MNSGQIVQGFTSLYTPPGFSKSIPDDEFMTAGETRQVFLALANFGGLAGSALLIPAVLPVVNYRWQRLRILRQAE